MLFAAVVVPLTLITGTLVGLLLNRLGQKMAVFVSTAALLAWATPPVSASVLFYWLFNPDGGAGRLGAVQAAALAGRQHATGPASTGRPPARCRPTRWSPCWWSGRSFPFIAVAVLAGLKTVPAELLEAARVDGASPWRVFWKITYPLLKPIFLVLLLLSVIWDFNVFTQTYILTGVPGNQNEYNLSLYLYDKAFDASRPATAWAARWR